VKCFTWEDAKNRRLKAERGVVFDDIAFYIKRGNVLDTIERQDEGARHHQRAFVLPRDDYVYLVPFVEDDTSVFLETIIPRRRATAQHPHEEPGLLKLDDDEQEIHDSFGRGEWRSVRVTKQEGNRYARYARATFRKDRRLNIRISSRDLEAIQKRAIEEGLPYQTLISSLIHKFASGRLHEP
jgi:predicted DNA binding CopG/RHH family protein